MTDFSDFVSDVRHRTQRAVPQADVFAICDLPLLLQAQASRFTTRRV